MGEPLYTAAAYAAVARPNHREGINERSSQTKMVGRGAVSSGGPFGASQLKELGDLLAA
jgi:N-acetyl-anhydromuramyl-L-alanine amidase AmpD